MDKENMTYTQNGVVFSHKEEGNHVICRKMVRSRDMLNKIS
jgi:hypothetical protein